MSSLASRHTATLIFLPDLADSGAAWVDGLETRKPPHLKLVCPTTSLFPVARFGSRRPPAWYTILSGRGDGRNLPSDPDLELAVACLERLVARETEDVPRERIMIGGSLWGGVVALKTALRLGTPLAGCVVQSARVPDGQHLESIVQFIHDYLPPLRS